MNLRSGSCLQHNRYRIESVLGQGGFGITYRAIQLGLDRPVAIKEFFMKEYCNRNKQNSHVSVGTEGSRELVKRFRQKFIKEAKTIASLRHPHIVSIHDVFEENGTAYYVMEYYEGGSLSDLLKQRGPFAEHEALDYIRQVASALSYIHERSINHLDVKPGNVLLNATGQAVLIDFGLSKHYDSVGQETSTTPGGISEGYAPPEQYRKGGVGQFTPSTDVYSLGAMLYKLLSGETPPSALDVADEGLPPLPATVSKVTATAIEQAMQPARKMRPQTVADFLALLPSNEVPVAPAIPVAPVDKEASQTVLSAENRRKQEEAEAAARKQSNPTSSAPWWKRPMVWGAAVVALVLLGVLIFGGKGGEMPEPTPTPVEDITYTRTINGPEAVDLGLSVRWATCNVGADSPEDYGDYFAWGETSPKSTYTWNTYKWYGGAEEILTKYCSDRECGTVDNKKQLEMSDDAARVNWGSPWRMPTEEEWKELEKACTWTWTTHNGVKGYKVVSKKNGNSIFLPAAGCREYGSLDDVGSIGNYWSSSLDASGPYYACYLYLSSGYVLWGSCPLRYYGYSVRPVVK